MKSILTDIRVQATVFLKALEDSDKSVLGENYVR